MPASPSTGDFSIVHRLDSEITDAEDHELRRLLFACFPYETVLLARRYIRQSPGHRWLVRTGSGDLIAHTGVHDKIVSVGGVEVRLGGIAEVCVTHAFRGRGLVGRMLGEGHAWMRSEGIPFAMLFGHPRVYTSSGYKVIENPIQTGSALLHHWNPFKGKPMIRPLTTRPWPAGLLDLRGPTF